MKNRFRLTKLNGQYKNEKVLNFHVISNKSYFFENDEIMLRGWVQFNDELEQGFLPKLIVKVGRKEIDLPIEFFANEKINQKFKLPKETISGFRTKFKFNTILSSIKAKTDHYSIDLILQKEETTFIKVFSLALSIDNYIRPLVFVAGSPRSGTSVSGNALREALNSQGFGESHVSNIFSNSLRGIEQVYMNSGSSLSNKSLIGVVNGAVIKASVINGFKAMVNNYLTGDYLVDKTPGIPALLALGEIFEIWPETKVVFCKRRGLENVASRINKFEGVSFENHCMQWAKTFDVWDKVKRNLFEGENYIEIDQYDIQEKPNQVALELSMFITQSDKLQKTIESSFRSNRPQKTQEITKPNSLNSMSWTKEQKEIFIENCGNTMKKQGYSMDENYFLKS